MSVVFGSVGALAAWAPAAHRQPAPAGADRDRQPGGRRAAGDHGPGRPGALSLRPRGARRAGRRTPPRLGRALFSRRARPRSASGRRAPTRATSSGSLAKALRQAAVEAAYLVETDDGGGRRGCCSGSSARAGASATVDVPGRDRRGVAGGAAAGAGRAVAEPFHRRGRATMSDRGPRHARRDVAWVRLRPPGGAERLQRRADRRAARHLRGVRRRAAGRAARRRPGRGRAVFCAGADVEWMRAAIGLSVDDNERDAAAMQAMFAAIDACPVPVIARVQGAALGAAWACAPSATSSSPPPTRRSASPRRSSGSSRRSSARSWSPRSASRTRAPVPDRPALRRGARDAHRPRPRGGRRRGRARRPGRGAGRGASSPGRPRSAPRSRWSATSGRSGPTARPTTRRGTSPSSGRPRRDRRAWPPSSRSGRRPGAGVTAHGPATIATCLTMS